MIDTHCHLTFKGLHERAGEVVARAHEAGVDRMISVGTTPDDARHAAQLAATLPGVYASAGLHPHYVTPWRDGQAVRAALRELVQLPRVVALGEMGLDRHYPEPPLDEQRRAFAWQLELAAELPGLPIIIHNREATADTLAMLRDSGLDPARFVFHCFTGSRAELDDILSFGAMVSFTGVVTFRNALPLAQAAAAVPAQRIMVETDSPFLTPEPHRKVTPNEPRFVRRVAEFLAQVRGEEPAAFVARVDANAQRFFRLPQAH